MQIMGRSGRGGQRGEARDVITRSEDGESEKVQKKQQVKIASNLVSAIAGDIRSSLNILLLYAAGERR